MATDDHAPEEPTLELLKQHVNNVNEQEIQRLAVSHPELFRCDSTDQRSGYSILHFVAQSRVFSLNTTKAVYDADPSALTHTSVFGTTPLHLAASSGSLPVVEFLVECSDSLPDNNLLVNEGRLSLSGNDGITPLWRASITNDASVIEFLLDHEPRAAGIRNKSRNSYPLHVLCRQRPNEASTRLIKKMMNAFPVTSFIQGTRSLPLDSVAQFHPFGTLQAIFEQCPQLHVRDANLQRHVYLNNDISQEKKKYVIEQSCRYVVGDEEWSRFPLHSLLCLPQWLVKLFEEQRKQEEAESTTSRHNAFFDTLTMFRGAHMTQAKVEESSAFQEFLTVLLHTKRHLARCLNQEGRLPLHLAIAEAGSTAAVTRLLHEKERRSALIRDPATGLWPFQAIGTASTEESIHGQSKTQQERIDLIFTLFRENPSRFLEDVHRGLEEQNRSLNSTAR